jgi:translation initiation factor 2 beta subunit (eIF-2beta)/eIF-5
MNYTFDFDKMVDECYELLNNNSSSLDKQVNNLILPNMIIETSVVRLHWKNVIDYLNVINRNPEHFIDFLRKEMPNKQINWYSGDKKEGLLIHSNRQKKAEISNLAIKYVNNYVSCLCCHKNNSELTKDIDTKKYEFKCLECGFNKFI